MIQTDASMRTKFGFRARFRMNRHRRGFLPLQRKLFHRRRGVCYRHPIVIYTQARVSINEIVR